MAIDKKQGKLFEQPAARFRKGKGEASVGLPT